MTGGLMTELSLNDFAIKISEIQPVLLREFLRRQVGAISQGSITPQQILVMEILFNQQESRMKDLAQALGVSMATMTGIVDRLVRHNFVERIFDQKDRRIIKTRLTLKGKALLKKYLQKKRNLILDVFSKLSSEERTAYLTIIQKVKNILHGTEDAASDKK
ncbi:MAG: MarR family transcriptional regulator [Candidatus Omnitrophica bacterium]|nr:MarR family transcriptional regulator [Candidatus Omnitrophota bacterium]